MYIPETVNSSLLKSVEPCCGLHFKLSMWHINIFLRVPCLGCSFIRCVISCHDRVTTTLLAKTDMPLDRNRARISYNMVANAARLFLDCSALLKKTNAASVMSVTRPIRAAVATGDVCFD